MQAGEPGEMLLQYLRRELDGLKGFLGIENCARFVHHSSVSVSMSPQLWSEGVHIPSSPEDTEYDSVLWRNVSLGVHFGQYAKAVDGHAILLHVIPH